METWVEKLDRCQLALEKVNLMYYIFVFFYYHYKGQIFDFFSEDHDIYCILILCDQ